MRNGFAVFVAIVFVILAGASGARAQSGLCADPGAYCSAALPKSCLERLGAGAVEAEASGCKAQLDAYSACIGKAASQCGAGRSDPGRAEEAKAAFDAVATSKNPEEFDIVAQAYAGTVWGKLAAARAKALRASAAPIPAAAAPAAARPASASTGTSAAPVAEAGPDKAVVRAMQAELKKKCFYRGGIDGDWGPGSKAALAAFRSKAGVGGVGLDQAGVSVVRKSSAENCAAVAAAASSRGRTQSASAEPAAQPKRRTIECRTRAVQTYYRKSGAVDRYPPSYGKVHEFEVQGTQTSQYVKIRDDFASTYGGAKVQVVGFSGGRVQLARSEIDVEHYIDLNTMRYVRRQDRPGYGVNRRSTEERTGSCRDISSSFLK